MNKFILNTENAVSIETDIMIAGCGAAGLYAALSLPPEIKCIILNKDGKEVSNSIFAQGGISAVTQQDEFLRKGHIEDTLLAGAGLCNEEAVRILVSEAAENIEKLIEFGVPFDRKNGELLKTREGGHRERRILHCGGDATGLYITKTFLEKAMQRDNIKFIDYALITDILSDDRGVTGALILKENKEVLLINTRRIILASGGIGRIYSGSTNALSATGDGMALALRAGAALKDMEFIQFHPTVLCGSDSSGRSFLVSEALRGEGARLMNSKGIYFMEDAHPMADLAPRDIVARAIFSELEKSGDNCVYLDITHRDRDFLKERFPTIFTECMERGIDISEKPIPVHPLQHYIMGGIKTGLYGETALKGLYACGETACTGIHGANRLASNSLLECLVFGRRAALHASALSPSEGKKHHISNCSMGREKADWKEISEKIQFIMTNCCGIIRDGKCLSKAIKELKAISNTLENSLLNTKDAIETFHMSLVALAVAEGAMKREKSIGAHYRKDSKEDK